MVMCSGFHLLRRHFVDCTNMLWFVMVISRRGNTGNKTHVSVPEMAFHLTHAHKCIPFSANYDIYYCTVNR